MASVTTWLGTAAQLFAADSSDYGGSKVQTAVEVLTVASSVRKVATTIFAFRSFCSASSADSALVIFGLACSPFVAGGMLALNGTEPGIHFTPIDGLLSYGSLAEITVVALLLSWAIWR